MKLILSIVAVALSLTVGHAFAADYKVGSITISKAWARATPKGAQIGGAYMTITNSGKTADRLVGGSSPVAARFELHRMTMDNGVMKMRPLKNGIEIKPGATVELKPDAMHVMLVGLKKQLVQGQQIAATLRFEKAGQVNVEYRVESIGATGAATTMAPMHHHMSDH